MCTNAHKHVCSVSEGSGTTLNVISQVLPILLWGVFYKFIAIFFNWVGSRKEVPILGPIQGISQFHWVKEGEVFGKIGWPLDLYTVAPHSLYLTEPSVLCSGTLGQEKHHFHSCLLTLLSATW